MTATDLGARGERIEVVRLATLAPVYERPSLSDYLAQLWDRRHFILADARGRVVSGSRGLALGLGWIILRPILDGLAFYTIFGLILRTDRGIENFLGYLMIGVFLFAFTSRCLTGGATSVTGGKNMVKAFTFPRAALPIAVVVRESISTIPVVGIMIVLILALPPLEVISWRWAIFPLVLLMQALFNLGIALWAARLVARLPDINQLIRVFTRFWLYASAVFFSIDRFVTTPWLQTVMKVNPLFIVLDMSRDVLLYGQTPEASSWLLLSGWTLLAGVGGMIFFWRGEERYGSV